jgi:hypothetical protein
MAPMCSLPVQGSDLFHRWSLYARKNLGLLGTGRRKLKHTTNYARHVLIDKAGMLASEVLAAPTSTEVLAALLAQRKPDWLITVVDLSSASLREYIQAYSNVSLAVVSKGADSLIGAAYMPVGTRHCCGILEVSQNMSGAGGVEGISFSGSDISGRMDIVNSFGDHARFMGHHHREVTIVPSEAGQETFLAAVEEVGEAMTERPSCLKV